MKTILQISVGLFLLGMSISLFYCEWTDHKSNTVPVTAVVVECYQEKGYLCDYATDKGYVTKVLERQDWKETLKSTGKSINVILPSQRGGVFTNILFGLVSLIGFGACMTFAVLPKNDDEEKESYYNWY